MITAKFMYPDNGYPSDIDWAQQQDLKRDTAYEVASISAGQSSSRVYLLGFDKGFNTVQFEFYEDGEPIDIYRDGRFSGYTNLLCDVDDET